MQKKKSLFFFKLIPKISLSWHCFFYCHTYFKKIFLSQWSNNIQRSLRCICLRLIKTKIIFSCWLLFIIILKLHETNINFILNICVARYEFVSLPILHEDKHAVFILLCLHHKNCFQIWLIIVLPDTIKTLFFLKIIGR